MDTSTPPTSTSTPHAWRREAEIEDDDHSSKIGGTP
jgi:hypothetical protein